ncbi:MAG: PilZ domain-containing protein [Myxococcaceae bacterium]
MDLQEQPQTPRIGYARERNVPRSHRRLRVELNGWRGYTTDVSLNGFSAVLLGLPRRGGEVRGTIEIGKRAYMFSGQIVWVIQDPDNRGSRVGVRFSGIENLYLQSFAMNGTHPL